MAKRSARLWVGRKRERDCITVVRLNVEDLCDASKSTQLPYPGMNRCCRRPGLDVKYVGREVLYDLVFAWKLGCSKFLVFGPKGVGKSTDFRACFCVLYKWAAEGERWDGEDNEMLQRESEKELEELKVVEKTVQPEMLQGELKRVENSGPQHQGIKERLVFLWTDILLHDELCAVKSALHFTFLADNDQRVEAAVGKLGSLEEVVRFIQRRKEYHAERFHFFVDGGEKLDPLDFWQKPVYHSTHTSTVVDRLKFLLGTGDRLWWCASAKARMTSPEELPRHLAYGDIGFSKEEYDGYAANCILGKLETRYDDIVYLTGLVPLFLDALCSCCHYTLEEATDSEWQAVKESSSSFKNKLDDRMALYSKAAEPDLVALLEEDDYWDSVVRRFMDHPELKLASKKANELLLTRECLTDEDIARLDPTYVLNADEGLFCSGFIKRLYLEAVRAKEEELKPYAGGAWLAYARKLLRSDQVNWSSLGWLCEEVLASVIQKKGLVLGGICMETLTLRSFDEVPPRSISDLLQMKPNSGYYSKPRKSTFPHVDAVAVWIDEVGNLVVVALQYTANIDEHLESADLFMSIQSLMQWFPDIEAYLRPTSTGSTSTSSDRIKLHYAFLGCSSKPGYHSGVKSSRLRVTKRKTLSGIAGYHLHIQPFDDSSLPGLDPDDYKVLLQIAERRTRRKTYCKKVCQDGVGLLALHRKVLENKAKKECGIQEIQEQGTSNQSNGVCC